MVWKIRGEILKNSFPLLFFHRRGFLFIHQLTGRNLSCLHSTLINKTRFYYTAGKNQIRQQVQEQYPFTKPLLMYFVIRIMHGTYSYFHIHENIALGKS